MKRIIITESQYRSLILEQEYQWGSGDETKDSKIVTDPATNTSVKNSSLGKTMVRKKEDVDWFDWDDAVDVVSAVLDGVPGIGNIASFSIDITHALTYFVRLYLSDSTEDKIINGAMGLITIGTSFIPGAGNGANILAKKSIKSILKETPDAIMKLSMKLGISKKTGFFLQKGKWKYCIWMVLARILGDKLIDLTRYVTTTLNDLKTKIEDSKILNGINHMVDFLNEMKDYTHIAIQLSKEMTNRNNNRDSI
tara:strand:- start:1018 stop:1773 length:756 start_codon:yes stop_codon:yes gene_type:complete